MYTHKISLHIHSDFNFFFNFFLSFPTLKYCEILSNILYVARKSAKTFLHKSEWQSFVLVSTIIVYRNVYLMTLYCAPGGGWFIRSLPTPWKMKRKNSAAPIISCWNQAIQKQESSVASSHFFNLLLAGGFYDSARRSFPILRPGCHFTLFTLSDVDPPPPAQGLSAAANPGLRRVCLRHFFLFFIIFFFYIKMCLWIIHG